MRDALVSFFFGFRNLGIILAMVAVPTTFGVPFDGVSAQTLEQCFNLFVISGFGFTRKLFDIAN